MLSTYVLSIDSRDRDRTRHPHAGQYDIWLPQRYHSVEKVELLDVQVPSTFYVYAASDNNNTMKVALLQNDVIVEQATVTIPDGNYTASSIVTALQTSLNAAFSSNFVVELNTSTMKVTITNASGYHIRIDTTTASTGPTEWGLGYYFGFDKNVVLTSPTPLTAPHPTNVNPVTYLFLDVDPFNHIVVTGNNGSMKAVFAKVPVSASNTITYLNSRTTMFAPCELQAAVAKVPKITIIWRHYGGQVVDFMGYDHSFTLRVTCRDRIPSTGGSIVTEYGRSLT